MSSLCSTKLAKNRLTARRRAAFNKALSCNAFAIATFSCFVYQLRFDRYVTANVSSDLLTF